jgi:hypothetical protein
MLSTAGAADDAGLTVVYGHLRDPIGLLVTMSLSVPR